MTEPVIARDPTKHGHGNSLSPHGGSAVAGPRTSQSTQDAYVSSRPWSATRPKTLVIACSDGRLQESIDEFLEHHLGVLDYDRLYGPGGPGMLATSSLELLRADQFRREFSFLRRTHGTEQVILLFHGASEGGPEAAVCGHYKRTMARASHAQIVQQQYHDMVEILRQSSLEWSKVRVHVFRAEVHADASTHFVDLLGKGT
jgi:hypothetical protein